ncbi:MAG: hypothetical protein L0Z48_12080 [candidate division Zixibacteria bacterium]|nr:hypothetical protein [candidate division Zixibacteria bacterium]
MKKLFALAVVLMFATSARAQFLGQLTDARVLEQGHSQLGGYIGIYSDDVLAFFGQFRYGLAQSIDAGGKIGFVDLAGGESGVGVAGDARYQLLHQRPPTTQQVGQPVDLSLGGGLEFYFGDVISIFSIQFNGIVSHRFVSAGGRGITPYGRAQIRFERVSVDLGPFGDASDTDGEFGINAGGEFEFAQQLSAVGELQLDSSELADFGLIFGLNYRF